MIAWLLWLCILCRPFWQSDLALLRTMPYEYAIVYSADYSVRIETTQRSRVNVATLQYSRVMRNGGHVMHNHLSIGCPSFSYGDIQNAMLMNLADTVVVAWDGKVYYAIRGPGGWKYLGLAQWERVFYKYGGDCLALRRTWQELSGKFGFIYREGKQ